MVTGEDARAWSTPFIVGVRQPMEHWCIATDRVRYAGEPVAIVVAEDRYRAEDALALIDVRYEPLPAIVDPEATLEAGAPVLHEAVGSNLISERAFRYGEPEAAFAEAAHTVATTVRYPRNSCTPIECLGLIAAYDPGEGVYDVLSHFQGPMTLHPVMARALKVPGPRLRLRSVPDSGGSFGVKQAIFPLIVAMALAARKAARPVKWIEDRLEHLLAANAATNRVTRIEAAVEADGRVTALRLDQLEDCGAYLKAPEPATLYRNHGNLTGPYRIAHLAVTNRVVVTNKTPTGLNRGFGGPQLYYALERLMQRVCRDPRPRPAGGDPAQPGACGRHALPRRRRRRARFRRFLRHRGLRGSGRGAQFASRETRGGAGRRPALRHRLRRGGGAQHLQHGLHHHRAQCRRAA